MQPGCRRSAAMRCATPVDGNLAHPADTRVRARGVATHRGESMVNTRVATHAAPRSAATRPAASVSAEAAARCVRRHSRRGPTGGCPVGGCPGDGVRERHATGVDRDPRSRCVVAGAVSYGTMVRVSASAHRRLAAVVVATLVLMCGGLLAVDHAARIGAVRPARSAALPAVRVAYVEAVRPRRSERLSAMPRTAPRAPQVRGSARSGRAEGVPAAVAAIAVFGVLAALARVSVVQSPGRHAYGRARTGPQPRPRHRRHRRHRRA